MELSWGVIAGINTACIFWGVCLMVTGASRKKGRDEASEQGTTLDRTKRRKALRRAQRRVFGGMVLNAISLAGWIYLLAAN